MTTKKAAKKEATPVTRLTLAVPGPIYAAAAKESERTMIPVGKVLLRMLIEGAQKEGVKV